MSNAFDIMHRANMLDIINLLSDLKINNAYYPNVEMIWILRQPLKVNMNKNNLNKMKGMQQYQHL